MISETSIAEQYKTEKLWGRLIFSQERDSIPGCAKADSRYDSQIRAIKNIHLIKEFLTEPELDILWRYSYYSINVAKAMELYYKGMPIFSLLLLLAICSIPPYNSVPVSAINGNNRNVVASVDVTARSSLHCSACRIHTGTPHGYRQITLPPLYWTRSQPIRNPWMRTDPVHVLFQIRFQICIAASIREWWIDARYNQIAEPLYLARTSSS